MRFRTAPVGGDCCPDAGGGVLGDGAAASGGAGGPDDADIEPAEGISGGAGGAFGAVGGAASEDGYGLAADGALDAVFGALPLGTAFKGGANGGAVPPPPRPAMSPGLVESALNGSGPPGDGDA